jgi:hypothetical protein
VRGGAIAATPNVGNVEDAECWVRSTVKERKEVILIGAGSRISLGHMGSILNWRTSHPGLGLIHFDFTFGDL